MNNHKELTQKYSTWGDKLLQHTDVLHSIQNNGVFKPITVQLAPCEVCDSDCPFCSVAGRPLKSYMPFSKIVETLKSFKLLGAKSVEITGGGNPYLYNDRDEKKDINDVIELAHSLGYKIGMITNTYSLKRLKKELYDKIDWIRISLIKLDEGKNPEDYDFNDFPMNKLAFSYIIYETNGFPDQLSRTNKAYQGTTKYSIEKIAKLVELYPEIKFVRIAGNCLIKGNNEKIKDQYREVINAVDKHSKFFIKDIGLEDSPFNDGCYIGMIRPYVAPNPHGGDYRVYICTSHVLQKRVYDLDYSLCSVDNIIEAWAKMNEHYQKNKYPYEVKNNKGNDWCDTCKFCYYKFNNKLLHTVANEMPDKDFP